jgi:hypothetical protein
MIEERVSTAVEQPMHIATQRRDPVRIIAMEAIGQLDKAIAVAPAAERGHLDKATFRQVPLAREASMGGIWRDWNGSAIHHHRSEDQQAWREVRRRPYVIEFGTVLENRDCKKCLVPCAS